VGIVLTHLRAIPTKHRTALLVLALLVVAVALTRHFHLHVTDLFNVSILMLGVSFALQSLVQSLAAGVVLLLENRIKIGDSITVAGFSGVVTSRQIRTTTLRAESGGQILVPNLVLFSSIILDNGKDH
jgi:small conductance mechanosensitive channel